MSRIIIENHPFSKLAKQIDNLLWASVILSTAIAALSLMNMGRLSLFMGPVMFMLTLLHNFVLLSLASRNRKIPSESLTNKIPPTATKANIVITWLLAALWTVVVLLIIVVSVIIMASDRFEAWERLAGYIELPFVGAEVALLVVLALKCRKQRRSSIIEPERVDWEHYGQPQPGVA
ncbi:hypothetical protein CPC08DRAFT_96517 [Agrocybe pediades]|nr:hypothetical protein CPC08DRAFT_96517 [Agrocybe pediades]